MEPIFNSRDLNQVPKTPLKKLTLRKNIFGKDLTTLSFKEALNLILDSFQATSDNSRIESMLPIYKKLNWKTKNFIKRLIFNLWKSHIFIKIKTEENVMSKETKIQDEYIKCRSLFKAIIYKVQTILN